MCIQEGSIEILHHSQPFKRKKKTISHWTLSSQTLLGWLTSTPSYLCFLHERWHCHHTLLSPAVLVGIRAHSSRLSSRHFPRGSTSPALVLSLLKALRTDSTAALLLCLPSTVSSQHFLFISLVINGHPSWGEMEAHWHFDLHVTAQFAKYPNLNISFFSHKNYTPWENPFGFCLPYFWYPLALLPCKAFSVPLIKVSQGGIWLDPLDVSRHSHGKARRGSQSMSTALTLWVEEVSDLADSQSSVSSMDTILS